MNISSKMKLCAISALIVTGCSDAFSQRHYRYRVHHPSHVVVVTKSIHHPVVTSRISNRFNQKERLAMALAYLNRHPRLTIKQYSKITSLSKTTAEVELDAFALDRNIPIHTVIDEKNKFYVISNTKS